MSVQLLPKHLRLTASQLIYSLLLAAPTCSPLGTTTAAFLFVLSSFRSGLMLQLVWLSFGGFPEYRLTALLERTFGSCVFSSFISSMFQSIQKVESAFLFCVLRSISRNESETNELHCDV